MSSKRPDHESPEGDERPFKRGRLLRSLSQVVTLAVGEDEDIVLVHQNVLCEASPFFKAACKPEWMKPEDRVIKLTEADVEAVEGMVFWMYNDVICMSDGISHGWGAHNDCETALETSWGFLVQLHVLGQKYMMLRLRNDAVDGLLYNAEFHCDHLNLWVMPFVYENTDKGSPLRQLFVALGQWMLDYDELNEYEKGLHNPYLVDLTSSYIFHHKGDPMGGRGENPWENDVVDPTESYCLRFHQHSRSPTKRCAKLKKYILDEE